MRAADDARALGAPPSEPRRSPDSRARSVIAIDIDERKVALARQNAGQSRVRALRTDRCCARLAALIDARRAAVYGVAERIEFIVGDYLDVVHRSALAARLLRRTKART